MCMSGNEALNEEEADGLNAVDRGLISSGFHEKENENHEEFKARGVLETITNVEIRISKGIRDKRIRINGLLEPICIFSPSQTNLLPTVQIRLEKV